MDTSKQYIKKIKVESFNEGNDGNVISPDCQIEINNPVFVYRNFDKTDPKSIIGEAVVTKESDGLYAELSIYDNKPDSKWFKHLYPAIGGRINERNGSGQIIKMRLNEVSLNATPNNDPTIKQIKDQI